MPININTALPVTWPITCALPSPDAWYVAASVLGLCKMLWQKNMLNRAVSAICDFTANCSSFAKIWDRNVRLTSVLKVIHLVLSLNPIYSGIDDECVLFHDFLPRKIIFLHGQIISLVISFVKFNVSFFYFSLPFFAVFTFQDTLWS